MKFTDQLNRVIELHKSPKRIISLVPSLTELVCDLGLELSLVGVTKFCVHPHHIRKHLTVVGGTKQVQFDKIRDLNPDIILCNKEENTRDMIYELDKIASIHISDINTIQDCLEIIDMYGEIFEKQTQAESLILKIKKEEEEFELYVKDKPIQTVAYFIWKDPWMAVGKETFIDYMLSINRFKNYFHNQSRYPEIDMKNAYKDVDLVMLSSEPYPFKKEHFVTAKNTFPKAKVVLIDGEMFSWYGSRLIKAYSYFKKFHEQLIDV